MMNQSRSRCPKLCRDARTKPAQPSSAMAALNANFIWVSRITPPLLASFSGRSDAEKLRIEGDQECSRLGEALERRDRNRP